MILPSVQRDLEHLLELAEAERLARNSPQWSMDLKSAFERHGDAVEALYDELYRQLDERADTSQPVQPAKATKNIRREVEREITNRLRKALPDMVAEALR